MIVATAPGRCGIVGNPSDMYGGSVLSCTTAERARCEIAESSGLIIEREGTGPQEVGDASDLAPRGDGLDLIRAVLRGLEVRPETHRLHLKATSEIPVTSGLGATTALTAAVFGAVAYRLGIKLHPYAMAEAIRTVEYEMLDIVRGFQDAYMSVFGGLNYMDFRDKGSHLRPQDQPYASVEALHLLAPPLPILIAHTGSSGNAGKVLQDLRARWLQGEPAVQAGYERIGMLARHAKAMLLAGDWGCLADAMNENQQIQRDLGASDDACERMIAAACANGAIGAKLAGPGHSGAIVALTPEPERTAAALRAAGAAHILYPRPAEGLTVELRGALE